MNFGAFLEGSGRFLREYVGKCKKPLTDGTARSSATLKAGNAGKTNCSHNIEWDNLSFVPE